MVNNDIQMIEMDIEQANKAIALSEAIERLSRNPDYKAVFEDAYFTNHALQCAHALSEVSVQAPERQADLINDMRSISALKIFLRTSMHFGLQAKREISDQERELEILRQEEEV